MKTRMLHDLQIRWWLAPEEASVEAFETVPVLGEKDRREAAKKAEEEEIEQEQKRQEEEEEEAADEENSQREQEEDVQDEAALEDEDDIFPIMDDEELEDVGEFEGVTDEMKIFFGICAALDPRGKRLIGCSSREKEKIWKSILQMAKNVAVEKPFQEGSSSDKKRKLSVMMFGTQGEETDGAEYELTQYRGIGSLRLEANAFQWWKEQRNQFPRLFQLARAYLQIPATSAGVERSFSVTRTIANERNSTRSREVTNNLCKLSLNKAYWK